MDWTRNRTRDDLILANPFFLLPILFNILSFFVSLGFFFCSGENKLIWLLLTIWWWQKDVRLRVISREYITFLHNSQQLVLKVAWKQSWIEMRKVYNFYVTSTSAYRRGAVEKNFGEKGINFQSVLAVHSESHLFAKQWQYFKLSST